MNEIRKESVLVSILEPIQLVQTEFRNLAHSKIEAKSDLDRLSYWADYNEVEYIERIVDALFDEREMSETIKPAILVLLKDGLSIEIATTLTKLVYQNLKSIIQSFYPDIEFNIGEKYRVTQVNTYDLMISPPYLDEYQERDDEVILNNQT